MRFPSSARLTLSRSVVSTDGQTVVTREMPLDANIADVANRGDLYTQLQLPGKTQVRGSVQCNVVSLSGCADMLLSQEVNGHGVFTTTLERVWNSNAYAGSYTTLINTMQGQMGPTQTPQLGQHGPTVDQVVAGTPFN